MADIQMEIMSIIQRELGNRASLIKWLQATLNIDYSSAHRKARGNSQLKLEELVLLSQKLPAINKVWHHHNNTSLLVGKQSYFHDFESIEDYLNEVHGKMQQAVQNNMTLYYFARDFPIFLFLAHPVLTDYKMSMWTHELEQSGIRNLPERIHRKCKAIFKRYLELPSEEIWFTKALQNQMDQLHWHHSIEAINSEELKTIKQAFAHTLQRFQEFALEGSKTADKPSNYHLFSSGFSTLNNGGIFKNESHQELSLALMSVFFMATTQKDMMAVFEREYAAHLKSALSLQNQKWSAQFFGEQMKILEDSLS